MGWDRGQRQAQHTPFGYAAYATNRDGEDVELKRISPEEAQALLDGNEAWTYLDVRTEEEFDEGHVPGALNVAVVERTYRGMEPNADFLEEVRAELPLDAPIITGCLRGGRSLRAANLLREAGYTQVVDMRGGWDAELGPLGEVVYPGWVRRGLPVSTE
ncbi:MAG: rhodanese-like domain-containing protein [Myxococcota bacterium]|nr:rhodanese-like domain-containing protein [Myxococcota bacterium]